MNKKDWSSGVPGDHPIERLIRVKQLAPLQSFKPMPLHDVPAIARRLNVSEKTVCRLIDRNDLRAYRIGRQLRISEEELIRFLDTRRS